MVATCMGYIQWCTAYESTVKEWLFMATGIFSEHYLESSWQVSRIAELEPSTEGRSWEQWFSQPLGVVVDPLTVGDALIPYFLSDGEES
jgi:hypothetical protein